MVRASLVARTIKILPSMQESWIQFLSRDDSLEKGMATHSSILAGELHGQKSLAGYSPRDHKESDNTERLNTTTTDS